MCSVGPVHTDGRPYADAIAHAVGDPPTYTAACAIAAARSSGVHRGGGPTAGRRAPSGTSEAVTLVVDRDVVAVRQSGRGAEALDHRGRVRRGREPGERQRGVRHHLCRDAELGEPLPRPVIAHRNARATRERLARGAEVAGRRDPEPHHRHLGFELPEPVDEQLLGRAVRRAEHHCPGDHDRVERCRELLSTQCRRRAEPLIGPPHALGLADRGRPARGRVHVQLDPGQASRELGAKHRRDKRIRALERPEQADPHHDAGSLRESSHARNRCPAGHGYPADMLTAEAEYVLRTIEERGIRFIRLWFTDVLGFLKSFTITSQELEGAFTEGMGFDGSSIEGFSRIQESDMIAVPDPATFQIDPVEDRAAGRADVLRHLRARRHAVRRRPARRAQAPARSARPTWASRSTSGRSSSTSTSRALDDPTFLDQGGYFDETPLDVATDYRKRTVQYLESMGIPVEYVHHEVAPSASTRSTCATPTRSRWPTTSWRTGSR